MSKSRSNVFLLLCAAACLLATAMLTVSVLREARERRLQGRLAVQVTPSAPEPVGPAPAFELIDQLGMPRTNEDLRGKVWVADFIFTRCQLICPALTYQMSQIRDRLQQRPDWDRIRLVSFSVDPEHDTPEVLKAYGERFGAHPDHWLFLTGEKEAVWTMVEKGFRLALDESPENLQMPIDHSSKLVLIDARGRIRGYYSGLEETGHRALLADLDQVLAESSDD